MLETAERRWRGILEARADLAPAIDLQRRLLTLVSELGGAIENGSGELRPSRRELC